MIFINISIQLFTDCAPQKLLCTDTFLSYILSMLPIIVIIFEANGRICSTVERSTILLLSGNEFNINAQSELVRKVQSTSITTFSRISINIARIFLFSLASIKNDLLRFIGANSEEVGQLRKRLAEIYNIEYFVLLPVISGIMLISLCTLNPKQKLFIRGRS